MCPTTSSNATNATVPSASSPKNLNNNDADDDTDDGRDAPPPAKFRVKQRVYAFDSSSGLLYQAVIRRALFGPHFHQQVQIGLQACSEEEAQQAMAALDQEQDSWHYFVHYNKWNVTWDRWVSESDIMEESEASKLKAERYTQEHKRLLKEFKQGKKGGANGAEFLKQWRQRMGEIDKQLQAAAEKPTGKGSIKGNNSNGKKGGATTGNKKLETKPLPEKSTQKPRKSKSKDPWDNKAAIEREYQLRLLDLQGNHNHQKKSQNQLVMPFSLKKILVEAWEIISQCNMVANLPAKPTVRQALQQYLESKLSLLERAPDKADNDDDTDYKTEEVKKNTKPTANHSEDKISDMNGVAKSQPEISEQEARKQEWIDMVEGVAMFFDEALPFRLLYRRELPQYRVVESTFVLPIEPVEKAPTPMVSSPTTAEGNDGQMAARNGDAANPNERRSPNDKDTSKDESMTPVEDMTSSATAANDTSPTNEKTIAADPSMENTTDRNSTPAQSNHSPAATSSIIAEKTVITPTTSSESSATTRPMLPSEVYGCEHLLRLCLHLPELLADHQQREQNRMVSMGEAEAAAIQRDSVQQGLEKEVRQILGKVNDLIRFLHKHQSVMFADSYRKLNPAEQKEEFKFTRYMERKRKRAVVPSKPEEVGSIALAPAEEGSSPSLAKRVKREKK